MFARTRFWALIAAAALALVGCQDAGDNSSAITLKLSVEPSPPVVGIAQVRLLASGADGAAVSGGTLEIEGNMSHAGMTPSFASAVEAEPGVYVADLDLTMGGDWFILVQGRFPDGKTVEQTFDLKGVRLR